MFLADAINAGSFSECVAKEMAEISGVQTDAEFLAPEPSLTLQAMQAHLPLLGARVLMRPDDLELRFLLIGASDNSTQGGCR